MFVGRLFPIFHLPLHIVDRFRRMEVFFWCVLYLSLCLCVHFKLLFLPFGRFLSLLFPSQRFFFLYCPTLIYYVAKTTQIHYRAWRPSIFATVGQHQPMAIKCGMILFQFQFRSFPARFTLCGCFYLFFILLPLPLFPTTTLGGVYEKTNTTAETPTYTHTGNTSTSIGRFGKMSNDVLFSTIHGAKMKVDACVWCGPFYNFSFTTPVYFPSALLFFFLL